MKTLEHNVDALIRPDFENGVTPSATTVDGKTLLTTTYNEETGRIDLMPENMATVVIQHDSTDKKFPYKLIKCDGTDVAEVTRQGDKYGAFFTAPGDYVINETLAEMICKFGNAWSF